MNATVKEVRNDCVEIAWEPAEEAEKYHVYWADKDISTMKYQLVGDTKECSFVLKKATHVPHYLKVAAVKDGTEYEMSNLVETPLKAVFHEQLEKLNRGLIAVKTDKGEVLVIALAADHAAVVPAQFQGGHVKGNSLPLAGSFQVPADAGVGGYAPHHRHLTVACLGGSGHGPGHQLVADGGGEGGSQVRNRQFLPFLLGVVDQVEHGGLQAREGHVQGGVLDVDPRQDKGLVVPRLGRSVQGGAAGIAQPHDPGNLVKALPRRVVPGRPQDGHVRVAPYVHDEGGPPRDAQADKGRLQVRVGDVVGSDVPPHVVHGDEGHPQGIGHRLGKAHPHQHRPDEAGGIGHRHRVDVLAGQAGGLQGLVGQLDDDLDVLPGGDLGHHASIDLVHLHGRGNAVGQDGAAVLDQGHSGLVAGRFHSQNNHTLTPFSSQPGRWILPAQEPGAARGAAGSRGI